MLRELEARQCDQKSKSEVGSGAPGAEEQIGTQLGPLWPSQVCGPLALERGVVSKGHFVGWFVFRTGGT